MVNIANSDQDTSCHIGKGGKSEGKVNMHFRMSSTCIYEINFETDIRDTDIYFRDTDFETDIYHF